MSNEIVQPSAAAPLSATGHGLRNALVLAGLVAIWALAFWPTLSDMIAIWLRSETFAHGMVVLPIAAYLVWLRRKPLGEVTIRPAALIILPLLGAVLAWALGVAFSVAALEHLAATLALVLLIWTCVGHACFRLIAFPAFFLLFMAPVGDFLVPTLMHYTAEFTVGALRLSGIPVFQEGNNFILPNGRWSVVEACSGVRYLIASIMVGALFAYLNYRSWLKRAVFVVAAMLVPILANWLRAYLIVMLGYLSDNKLAAGVDHLIYGWVFFGVVILLLFWIGNRWRDADAEYVEVRSATGAPRTRSRSIALLLGVAALLGATAWAGGALRPDVSQIELAVEAPEPAPGWKMRAPVLTYRPALNGYRGLTQAEYLNDGVPVQLTIAVYAHQSPGHEMVNWASKLWPSDTDWGVLDKATIQWSGGRANRLRLSGPDGMVHVWDWYRVGTHVEVDGPTTVARLALRRLSEGSDVGAHVVVAVPGEDPDLAERTVRAFLEAHAQAIEAAIARAAGGADG
ncbi:MAG: exosortase A [Porticoccaceae bacterium]|nr:exosortase A [Porticoccaceae bacterium]